MLLASDEGPSLNDGGDVGSYTFLTTAAPPQHPPRLQSSSLSALQRLGG
jgi:hypothetical protein